MVVLSEYLRAAMRTASYEMIEDDSSFFGRITALEGFCANAEPLEGRSAELTLLDQRAADHLFGFLEAEEVEDRHR